MQKEMIRLVAVMLLIAAACRQAAAGPEKPTKWFSVTGVMMRTSSSAPKFKVPVFQKSVFVYKSGCNHCRDSTLTVKANAKGAPVITYVNDGNQPEFYYTTVTIVASSSPTITVVQTFNEYNGFKEIYRFKANITSLYREDVTFPWSQRAAVDSLNTVARNAASYTATRMTQGNQPEQVPYSPNMRLVVAYLKHLAAAAKGGGY